MTSFESFGAPNL